MYDSLISLPPVYLLLEGILDKLKDAIAEWLYNIVKSTAEGMSSAFQGQIGKLSSDLSSSPQGWNKAAYDLVKTIQDNAVIPVAMLILVFVFCYEFISLVAKKNTGQEVDVQEFFVIFGKTTFGIVFITHAWEIVMALFDLASYMINKAKVIATPQVADPAKNILTLAKQYFDEPFARLDIRFAHQICKSSVFLIEPDSLQDLLSCKRKPHECSPGVFIIITDHSATTYLTL